MSARAADVRSAALDAYIARRVSQGFRVETRTGAQAVIVRRHRLYFALHWFSRGLAEQRYVISVDEHGEVASLAAEPVRW
jgi:ABC-type phosphate/phosphonate transport system ATPase subunit